MVRIFTRGFIWSALCVTLAIGLAATAQAQSVTFVGSTTSSDYSPTGLDLGKYGFWFANFDAPTANSGSAIDANAANGLPGWVTVNPTPDTTFGGMVTSSGGQGWDSLTLPDGTTGESGALVDAETAGNSNNTIRMLELGPGAPRKFYFSIVTDNTNGAHDPASRLRARYEHENGFFDVDAENTPPGLAASMNSTPDVWTWLYDTGPFAAKDAFIKLQVNSGDGGEPASIAGFMFDPIPEPSSAMLLMLGAFGCYARLRRRRG